MSIRQDPKPGCMSYLERYEAGEPFGDLLAEADTLVEERDRYREALEKMLTLPEWRWSTRGLLKIARDALNGARDA